MKRMTKTQQTTFLAMASLSRGDSRPWLTKEKILARRFGSNVVEARRRVQFLLWIDSYLRGWSGQFVEQHPAAEDLWRLTLKGKMLAKHGDLP